MRGRSISRLGLAAVLLAGCADPLHDHAVAALGKETTGVPVGEFHRAGTPCVECHQQTGPASTTFTVAGTVFASPASYVGVYNAEVQMTDSVGTQYVATTNCVGNFFVTPTDWNPKFPILVRVQKGATAITMKGPIGREGSCGACHKVKLGDDDARKYMPHLALFGGDEPSPTLPDAGCPVSSDSGDTMTRSRAILAGAFAAASIAVAGELGCSDVPAATDQLKVTGPSLADFAALSGSVSGVFERNCGSIDCHGNEAKPLRLYSQYGLRLPPNFSTVNPPNTPLDGGTDGGDDGGITIPIDIDSGPPAVPGGIPTTPEEMLANYQSIIALEPRLMDAVVKGGDPYQLLLLKKPLLVEPHKGGPALHKGGDGEKCIVGWLKGQTDKAACTASAKYLVGP